MATRTDRSFARRVGEQLRQLRQEKEITQEMLAARLTTSWKSTSDATVSNWESGITPFPLIAFEPVAEALRVDLGYLGRRLGLCGSEREIRHAEAAELADRLADEPPEVADTILSWWRQSLEIARANRLARST